MALNDCRDHANYGNNDHCNNDDSFHSYQIAFVVFGSFHYLRCLKKAATAPTAAIATAPIPMIHFSIAKLLLSFDGLSIAWAVVEYIAKVVRAKTLFATHYHELTELEGRLDGVNNYCIAVTNHDQDIVFLRKIIPGGADQSYGIDVASLAGVPKPVIDRAKEIAAELSDADILAKARELDREPGFCQESLALEESGAGAKTAPEEAKTAAAAAEPVLPASIRDAIDYLRAIDINHMTPLDAMNTLYELKDRFKLS